MLLLRKKKIENFHKQIGKHYSKLCIFRNRNRDFMILEPEMELLPLFFFFWKPTVITVPVPGCVRYNGNYSNFVFVLLARGRTEAFKAVAGNADGPPKKQTWRPVFLAVFTRNCSVARRLSRLKYVTFVRRPTAERARCVLSRAAHITKTNNSRPGITVIARFV